MLFRSGTEAAGSAAPRAANYGKSSFDFNLSPAEAMSARTQHSAFTSNLAELRSSLIRSGMPDREVAAYMQRAGFYNNPEALQQAVLTVRKHGPSGLFERSADEAATAGIYNPKYGKSPLETWQQERAATEAANAKFRDMFGFSDVGKLAEAGGVGRGAAAAGREAAAGAATGSVSEGVDSASQQLIQHIRSGTLDEMERAWIEATAAGAAKAPGTVDASTQAILNEARAAGILGRDAAGTAGAADGGVSKLAEAGNVGRGVDAGERAAAERAGINAEIARANMEASDVFNAQLIQRIKAGTTTPDDIKVIWALMQARTTPYTPASDKAVVDAARAAGLIR